MTSRPATDLAGLQAENAELHRRLEVVEETLRAIQTGGVDAVVVESSTGHRVYTLEGADRPYRLLVEQMQQGAATLQGDGIIAYCNRRMAELLGASMERVTGRDMLDFIAPDSRGSFRSLLRQGEQGTARGELLVLGDGGKNVPVLLTLNPLPPDCGAAIGLLITDLTQQKHHELLASAHAALRESEAELRRQASQLAAFLDTAAVCLHRVGPDGTILWANDAELGLLGYARDEYVGRPIQDFHTDAQVIESILARLHHGEKLHGERARMRCKDGAIKDVLIDSSVLWDEGKFVHTQCFTRDITEQLKAQEKLRQSEADLREADHRKNQFLAMLSHELRNPLAPILHATQVLRLQERGRENALQRGAREVIERQTNTLARLVNDLLDIARLTTGRIELKREPVDLRQAVRNALETTAPQIEQRRHRLVESFSAEPVWLQADATRIEEVAVNLIGNAAKYTDEGGQIEVCVETDGRDGILRVRDSGVGIAPEVLPHVFELFTQADRTLERSQGGLGIGLHVVQRLIELHGGSVSASSAGLGQGSEFVVHLPRAAAPSSAPTPSSSAGALDRKNVRVLVVDDNADSCAMLGVFLRLQGYGVQMVHTGPEALDVGRTWRPDVVLLDIGLPGLDGYEVARRLREDFRPAAMRLVAITGYGRDQDVSRAHEAGFDAHLLKPVSPTEVERLVAGWMGPGSD